MKYCVRYWADPECAYLPTKASTKWRGDGCSFQCDGQLCLKDDPDVHVFESKDFAERWVKRRTVWMKARGRRPDPAMRVEEYP